MKVRLERVVLVAGMAVSSVSLWTAAPLLGLWVGSRVAPSSGMSMLALAVVAATIGVTCWLLLRARSWMSATYDGITGRRATVRRHTPWLRSMRGEREHGQPGAEAHLSPLEHVLVGTGLVAWLAFDARVFFFSSSPIDQRSGRCDASRAEIFHRDVPVSGVWHRPGLRKFSCHTQGDGQGG